MKAVNGLDEVNKNRNSNKLSDPGHILERPSARAADELDGNVWRERNKS